MRNITIVAVLMITLGAGVLYYITTNEDTKKEDVSQGRPFPYEGKYMDMTRYGFAVLVPKSFEVSSTPLGTASEIVLYQNTASSTWFQIFVTPYGGTTITEERVAEDTGASEIRETEEILVGVDGVKAAMFWHQHSQLGEMREVWFIQNGFLFEVTSLKSFDENLSGILATLHFYHPLAPQ